MPKLPRISGKTLLKILLKKGFVIDRQKGSHVIIQHETHSELVTTVPVHSNKDLPLGTLKKILRDLELSVEDIL